MLNTIPPSLWEDFNNAQITNYNEVSQKLIILLMQAQTQALERIADRYDGKCDCNDDVKLQSQVELGAAEIETDATKVESDEGSGSDACLDKTTV